MGKINSYKELIVWQKSMELAQEMYRLTSLFPKNKLFGIVSQMHRAAVSVLSNIAEGFGRKTKRDSDQLFNIAYSSGLELETQLNLSRNLGFVATGKFNTNLSLLDEVLRMLNKMTSNYRNKQ